MKYSQSQTYYYTKPINEFLHGQRNTQVIKLKELVSFSGVEGDEWMRRLYNQHEIPNKIHLLTEYYRFHNEIPRMFMIPESDIMNNYHDKKRRIEYFRIAKEIDDENRKNPDKPPKGIVGDKPEVKRESQDHSQYSEEGGKDVFYGNLLHDITLESSLKSNNMLVGKNESLTMQEINQRLIEANPNRNLMDMARQFERDLSNMPINTNNDEEVLKKFINSIELKPNFTKLPKKKNLNLNEELLDQPNPAHSTTSANQRSPVIRKQSNPSLISIRSPQSARNNPQVGSTPITAQPRTTLNKVSSKSGLNQPFFMSEALQAKIVAQQQLVNLHTQKQPKQLNTKVELSRLQGGQFSISPRSATKQPVLSQHVQQQQQFVQLKLAGSRVIQTPKQLMAQGFQGSQEAYQIEVLPQQIMSAKGADNLIADKRQQGKTSFPSASTATKQLNQSNNSKLAQKLTAMATTAESSPSHKIKQIVSFGSQTHRVTSQKDIQQLLRLKQQDSKDHLNKLLSPVLPGKQLNDFFLMQLQAMKSSQSNSSQTIRSAQNQLQKGVITTQLVRRNTKNAQLRKSLNQADPKSPSQPQHQHTKSDVNQLTGKIQAEMQKLDGKRVSK